MVKNEYILPAGNVLISFSGGRTSGYMLHQILEANGDLPDRAKVVFANTGREMPETLDFVQECSERWSVPITWLEYTRRDGKVGYDVVSHNSASRNGEPLEAMIRAAKYIPNTMRRKCTQETKLLTIKRYCRSLGWKKWINTVGIRADEAYRIKPSKDKMWDNWFPLFDAGMSKRDVENFWKRQPFDLQLPLFNGVTPHSNCDGCFLKSEHKLAEMWRDFPDRMEWWAKLEEEFGHTFRYDGATYRSIKDTMERQGDWIFDSEDFFCQKDGGECTG
jgi:3'-phosphoadenosine 5'-phosphosulfate sulfotransferase (PAPS reductase)/FAD synthetase